MEARTALRQGISFFKKKATEVGLTQRVMTAKEVVKAKADEYKVQEKAQQFGEKARFGALSAAEYTKQSGSEIIEGARRGTLGRQAGEKAAKAGAFFGGLSQSFMERARSPNCSIISPSQSGNVQNFNFVPVNGTI